MCQMREIVQVVKDDDLATPWLTATADDGQRVVFIREADQPLLGAYCALGPGRCPVWLSFDRRPAIPA